MLQEVILEYDRLPEHLDIEEIMFTERDFSNVRSLELVVDTTELSLTFLGDRFPNLEKLRLNNSKISSVRDIGCSFKNLRFLSLAHCGLTSLDGISLLSPKLEELYAAFNEISELNDVMGLDNLKIIDLEENNVKNIAEVEFLTLCKSMRALTLAGNPCANSATYKQDVMKHCKQLIYLDEKRLRPKRQPSSHGKRTRENSKVKFNVTSEDVDNVSNVVLTTTQDIIKQNNEKKDEKIVKNNDNEIVKPEKADTLNHDEKKVEKENNKTEFKTKIEKGQKVGIKPLSADSQQRPATITEYVEDMAEERPTTAKGFRTPPGLLSAWSKTNKQQQTDKQQQSQKIVNTKVIITPKLSRPVSSCIRFRSNS